MPLGRPKPKSENSETTTLNGQQRVPAAFSKKQWVATRVRHPEQTNCFCSLAHVKITPRCGTWSSAGRQLGQSR